MSTQFTNRQWRLPNNENKDKQSNYSVDFDSAASSGIITSLETEIQGKTELSFSLWFYSNSTAQCFLFDNETSNSNYRISLYYESATTTSLRLSNGSPQGRASFASPPINQWNHFVFTFDGSQSADSDKLKIYVNNSLQTITFSGTIPTQTPSTNVGTLIIGNGSWSTSPLPNYAFNGKIDGVSIFNYALSSSQITTLYGSSSTGIGNPMSLSPAPVAFYQLGDKSAFNGANYLVPNIAAQEADGDIAASHSPYALDFDGTNDIIDCGSDSSLTPTTAFSVSCWVYLNATGTQTILHNGSGNNNGYILFFIGSNLRFYIREGGSWRYFNSDNAFVANTWYNVTVTWGGSTMKMYINNALQSNTATASSINITTRFRIGAYGGSSNILNGRLSNISVWNSELTSTQVTEIYSEGVPQNLNNHSAYSNLVSWWQLGSNSSFNTNWTVLDEKGSNNGTSANMIEADIVDGVNSYANGTSSGMGGDEVIGDAPYSTANSLSVNMDVEDRTTDTPS